MTINDLGLNKQQSEIIRSALQTAVSFARVVPNKVYVCDVQHSLFVQIPSMADASLDVLSMSVLSNLNTMDMVIEEDRPLYKEIEAGVLKLQTTLPREVSGSAIISYSIRSIRDGITDLLTHTATPLALDDKGRVWLVLSLLSPSVDKKPGRFICRADGMLLEYDYVQHEWNNVRMKDYQLSANERQMLVYSARGHTLEEISVLMHRSVDTIKLYRRRIFNKLGANNITEAYAYALKYKLL